MLKTTDIEPEAKRVAVAFQVTNLRIRQHFSNMFTYTGLSDEDYIVWNFLRETGQLIIIRFGKQYPRCVVHRFSQGILLGQWQCVPHPLFDERMARGLYRLGLDDEDVLAKLNHPFSAHEQLELRDSMPRKYWPQKWLSDPRGQFDSLSSTSYHSPHGKIENYQP